jgi:hypothetical protein
MYACYMPSVRPAPLFLHPPPRPQATARLAEAHAGIHAALAEMHASFVSDGEDVQREWVRFTARVDRRLEDALRATVKRSLQALSRLLNGDSKTEVRGVQDRGVWRPS